MMPNSQQELLHNNTQAGEAAPVSIVAMQALSTIRRSGRYRNFGREEGGVQDAQALQSKVAEKAMSDIS